MADQGRFRSFASSWWLAFLVLTQVATTGVGWSQEAAPSISVTVNKSLIFRLPQKARRVSVTQPEVAEVVVVAPTQLLINGKSVGATSLIVWDERGEVTNFDLIVMPDITALRRQLGGLFPQEKIEISTSGPSIVLKGEVSNEVIYDKVLEITMTYLPPKQKEEVAPATSTTTIVRSTPTRLPQTGTAFAGGGQLAFTEETALTDVDRWGNRRAIPGIVDLLIIKESRQIQLNVTVAEVSLNKLRELGLDFTVFTRRAAVRSNAGSQGGFGELLGDISPGSPGGPTGIIPLEFGDATSGIFNYVSNRFQIAALYRLFQNRDITEILAQPSLVMKNGRSGGFLAGGEFPIPIATEDEITIEFKPFGVRLDFVPTLTYSNTIDLRVFPEVSEIDQSVSVTIAGISVPGLRVRRSVNRVEMKEGEALIISGLMDRRVLKDLTKFPILGDIPILGALFRSTRFRNQETELVFVITPQIVKALRPGEKPQLPSAAKYDDPDMRQIPLPGSGASDTSKDKSVPGGPTMP